MGCGADVRAGGCVRTAACEITRHASAVAAATRCGGAAGRVTSAAMPPIKRPTRTTSVAIVASTGERRFTGVVPACAPCRHPTRSSEKTERAAMRVRNTNA